VREGRGKGGWQENVGERTFLKKGPLPLALSLQKLSVWRSEAGSRKAGPCFRAQTQTFQEATESLVAKVEESTQRRVALLAGPAVFFCSGKTSGNDYQFLPPQRKAGGLTLWDRLEGI
jgi:hypothetical protein